MRIWYVCDLEHHRTRPTKKLTLGVIRSRVHEKELGELPRLPDFILTV